MKRVGIQKNNRGDSLILVIGCIALLSILGIVILAKSVDNQTMKVTEKKAQESFFAADSTSAELAAVLESISLKAIEDAFSDMLVEYSYSGNDTMRKQRYKEYFEARLSKELTSTGVGDNKLKELLKNALGGTLVTGLSVEYGDVTLETGSVDKTDIIKIKDVKLTYSAGGSETSVTTDIHIQTQIPDITAGFRPVVNCYFSDFALIADGSVALNTAEDALVSGNMYTGDNLSVSGTGYELGIQDATKVLVKGDIQVDGGAKVNISNGTALAAGQGVWANGIYVKGGGAATSSFATSNVNMYISDDLTVEGTNADITLNGSGSEYIGYSGGTGVSGLTEYKQSSAITINSAKNLKLKLSGLGRVVLSGTSYIHESDWDKVIDGTLEEVAGIMQGESVAYKDMQAMYLVPGKCMEAGHNPVMSGESVNVVSYVYTFTTPTGSELTVDLEPYLDDSDKVLRRTLQLDNGATEATYVYLNFKNEEMASKYVELYLGTAEGNAVKTHAKNLGTGSRIELPVDDTYTRANAFTYNGTAAGMRPAADATKLAVITSASLTARQRYNGLFTSLKENAGGSLTPSYKMVRDGIVSLGGVTSTGLVESVEIPDPIDSTKKYTFYLYNGDLTITGAPYKDMNGILLVNGNLTVASTNTNIRGLVLATGTVNMMNNATFTKDSTAVETLLADSRVAKYFKGFGSSDQQYLSSEAVDITFDNWKRN